MGGGPGLKESPVLPHARIRIPVAAVASLAHEQGDGVGEGGGGWGCGILCAPSGLL